MGFVKDSGGGAAVLPGTNGGRLTLETGVPVPASDQSAKTTLYYETFRGNHVALHDGSNWALHEIGSGVSIGSTDDDLDSTAIAVDSLYDIFLYLSGGALALGAKKWTNDTTRATALARQDGVLVLAGETDKRYLGTIRTVDSTGSKFEDSGGGDNQGAKRFVWNYDNRVPFADTSRDTTNSWNTSGVNQTYAAINGGAAPWRHEFVIGLDEHAMTARLAYLGSDGPAPSVFSSIGLDSSTAIAAGATSSFGNANGSPLPFYAHYGGRPGVGYHFLQGIETSGSTSAGFGYGDNGTTAAIAGMHVEGYR